MYTIQTFVTLIVVSRVMCIVEECWNNDKLPPILTVQVCCDRRLCESVWRPGQQRKLYWCSYTV